MWYGCRMSLLRFLPLLSLTLLAACAPGGAPSSIALPPGFQAVQLPGPEGVTLRAALALPEGPPTAPVVVALHGCGGIGAATEPLRLPARERDWAARLTAAGHPVLFPDSFGSRGHGPVCDLVRSPTDPARERRADVHAAAAWAMAQPWGVPGGVLLIGWSHGGSTVLEAVAAPLPEGLVRAAVGFYPGCRATLNAGGWQPAAPLLLELGSADDWTPPRFCLPLIAGKGGVQHTLHAGARHDFDWPGLPYRQRRLGNGFTVTSGLDPEARARAIAEVMAFFATHGGAAPKP